MLRCAMLAWRRSHEVVTFADYFTAPWLADLYVCMAVTAHKIGQLSRDLRKSCRADKRGYVAQLVSDLAVAGPAEVYPAFHKLVKPKKFRRKGMEPLPQLRQRDGTLCPTPEAVRDRWLEHFSSLEGGSVQSPTALVQDCISRQSRRCHSMLISSSELPSLVDMVDAFKAVQGGRASGPDLIPPEIWRLFSFELATCWWPVALKAFCQGCEPAGLKGGMQCRLQKPTGDRTLCASSRAILLQPAVAKAFHRATRKLISTRFEQTALDFQIGGRRNFSATFGSLCSRSFLRFGSKYACSCSITFVDLAAAYYAVIRELLFGRDASTCSLHEITDALGLDDDDLQCLAHYMDQEAVLRDSATSDFLLTIATEMHDSTWFFMAGDSRVVRTQRGTRPGGCMADALFSLLFAAVIRRAKRRSDFPPAPRVPWDGCKSLHTLESISATTHFADLEEVIFADDLASFALAFDSAHIIRHTVDAAECCSRHFMTTVYASTMGSTRRPPWLL